MPSVLLRRPRLGHLRGVQHILNEYSIPRCWIVDENVGDRPHELSVLDDGAARHECGQEGTTLFNGKFTKGTTFFERFALVIRFAFNYS